MSEFVAKLVKPTMQILTHVGEKVPQGLAHGHHHVGGMAKDAATKFEKTEEDIAKRVPVYVVDHDGKVHHLRDDGTLGHVAADDDSGVRNILDGNNTTETWQKGGKYNLTNDPDPGPGNRPVVTSNKVAPGGNPLSQATEDARKARGDSNDRVNYAAFHFQGPDSEGRDQNFILVASSKQFSAHSEQYAGIPLLANKDRLGGGSLVGMHTERPPCDTGRRCESWMAKYFGQNLPVTHSYEDDASGTAQSHLKNRLKSLFP